MTLDTLAQVLEVECCWVQTINARKRSLNLAAERGFNSEMRREMSVMDMGRNLSQQIVGLGNGIVIPDLSHDGRYGLPSFQAAGYKWLVAVPLMTYRVHGVLGIASRNKKRLRKETADLVTVIAGLIGTALNIAGLSEKSQISGKREQSPDKENGPDTVTPLEEIPASIVKSTAPQAVTDKNAAKPPDSTFHKHTHKMKSFRSLHQ
jgi:signal transduction protein with GAF and PtsI domain